MSALNYSVGIRRALRLVILFLTLAQFSGCDRLTEAADQARLEQTLQVSTSLSVFSGMVFVKNVGTETITIRRVTINSEYPAEYWPTPMGGRGKKFEPTQIARNQQVVLWLSAEWPRPEQVSVETDKGTYTGTLIYN